MIFFLSTKSFHILSSSLAPNYQFFLKKQTQYPEKACSVLKGNRGVDLGEMRSAGVSWEEWRKGNLWSGRIE